jgi:hypothetical protein
LTQSTWSLTPRWLSRRGVSLHLTQSTWSLTPCWLSRPGVALRVDTVDVESHLALTPLTGYETPHQLSHRQMLESSNRSANSRTKSKTLKSLIIWPIYVWSVQNTRINNISCKCTRVPVPLRGIVQRIFCVTYSYRQTDFVKVQDGD